ncbi:MAG: zinc ribbon domain-containing protein [Thermoplasmata archaeon]|nr:zinc ribbon domain-containing protein [Thermoplasmata archaeon]
MVYCSKCGATLPDGAQFCFKCGTPVPGTAGGGVSTSRVAAPTDSASLGAPGVQELKCPACGAPIHPVFGEMVITCEYCGGSVTLGGNGWKEISKHTMLPLKVPDRAAALKAVEAYVDLGFFQRHDFQESKIVEERLSYVPFWVVPSSATTNYQYQAIATTAATTVGTIAAGALLGSVLSGGRGRGGFAVVPIFGGPVVNPTRSETISGQYEYPIVAVKAMTAYQPKNYEFGLTDRTFFDKKSIPEGTPILNGDLGEDAAQHAAQSYVQQLQSEAAHKKHSMVSQVQTHVEVSEAELLHVPIWYFQLDHKGARTTVLIDGHGGRVIQTFQ